MGLLSFFNREVAMDLGTANSIVIYNDQVVIDEPSVVAVDRKNNKIMAVGKEAKAWEGKTKDRDIDVVRPLRGGVIADFEMAQHLIRELISMTSVNRSFLPPSLRMVICIPSGITNVEERAVRESAEQAGAKEIRMIHEPMAAAIGAGIDVLQPEATWWSTSEAARPRSPSSPSAASCAITPSGWPATSSTTTWWTI